jgi:hypothetical protein
MLPIEWTARSSGGLARPGDPAVRAVDDPKGKDWIMANHRKVSTSHLRIDRRAPKKAWEVHQAG